MVSLLMRYRDLSGGWLCLRWQSEQSIGRWP